MKTTVMNKFAFAVITFAFLFLGYIAFLLFWPPQIISPRIQPYKIVNHQVHAGDIVYYVADLCKYTDTPGILNRSIVGNIVYPLPDSTSHVEPGCSENTFGIDVPENILPGDYYLQLDIQYRVNFLRQSIYHLQTEKFTVIQ